ncbi:MAG: hypothetical protein HYX77_02265 [Acidobacteria bacterium]|nr:hypothetical protein [Acidobacteriota bacterium]
MAVAILGRANVLTKAQAKGEVEFPIRYSENTLRACAKDNEEESCDWRLVYLRGNSLREERKRVGVNAERQPCFYDNNWWLGGAVGRWLRVMPEKFDPGYHLIDFNGRFGRTSWPKQEKAVRELGPQLQRAHEAMVTEAALRIFEATRERLLLGFYHWGYSVDFLNNRVYVGLFHAEGWFVDYGPPLWDGNELLRVCLVRKFES